MGRQWKRAMSFVLMGVFTLAQLNVLGFEGDFGYEGGISSGQVPGKISMEYKEYVFITGEPILYTGTLTIKKSLRKDNTTGNDLMSSVYTYALTNTAIAGTLSRVVTYESLLTKKDNGQTIEETKLNPKYSEVIKTNKDTYTLKNYDFTRTSLKDAKPTVDYFAGNIGGIKTYQIGAAGGAQGAAPGTLTVKLNGEYYGYNQYWGTTETVLLNYVLESEKKTGNTIDKWGGTVDVSISSSASKQIGYSENEPQAISFEGGYLQSQYNSGIYQFASKLPQFDSAGVSTDKILEKKDSLKLESFPMKSRLVMPDLNRIKGHWAENDIKKLYSLEILKESPDMFNPQEVMTRAEFADAIVLAAKEVPKDPSIPNSSVAKTPVKSKTKPVSPFSDVSNDFKYFENIKNAYTRNIMSGRGNQMFYPDDNLIVADAITVIIRAMGLESLAPTGGVVTTFRDNDVIPNYARNHAYVAQKIGLVIGDENGYLNPNENLTKARAAVIINKFINYMREDLKKDYRDRIVNYK